MGKENGQNQSNVHTHKKCVLALLMQCKHMQSYTYASNGSPIHGILHGVSVSVCVCVFPFIFSTRTMNFIYVHTCDIHWTAFFSAKPLSTFVLCILFQLRPANTNSVKNFFSFHSSCQSIHTQSLG